MNRQELLREAELVHRQNQEVLRRAEQRNADLLERMAEYSARVVDRAVRRLRAANGR